MKSDKPWTIGLRAAKANLIPGIVIQILALCVLILFYYYEPATNFFNKIAFLKTETGLIFATISTMVFGGLIPFVYLKIQDKTIPWAHLLFYLGFWAYKGTEVDLLYKFQDFIWQTNSEYLNLLMKVFFDQFVYNPILGSTTVVILYNWKDENFNFIKIRQSLSLNFYRHKIFPMLISTWGFWIPSVLVIYMLPYALQIPLFNLVQCLFTLLIASITKGENK